MNQTAYCVCGYNAAVVELLHAKRMLYRQLILMDIEQKVVMCLPVGIEQYAVADYAGKKFKHNKSSIGTYSGIIGQLITTCNIESKFL